jgi:CHAT domain-containing protein
VITTGIFVHLPIHVAGNYKVPGKSLSDYVVISRIAALWVIRLLRRNIQPIQRSTIRLLLAAIPRPLEWPALPFVVEESHAVELAVPVSSLNKLPLNASTNDILAQLPFTSILHLACHGYQNPVDPLDSGFVTGDGILPVWKLVSLQLPNAFLAFLSACETAKADEKQPDQVIHLAAAMLSAGFRSVIATMWYVIFDRL